LHDYRPAPYSILRFGLVCAYAKVFVGPSERGRYGTKSWDEVADQFKNITDPVCITPTMFTDSRPALATTKRVDTSTGVKSKILSE
jgi:hypothetical protein